MITKDLEAKVIEKIEAKLATVAGLPSHRTLGSWQPADLGIVKNVESPDVVAVVSVAIGTPSHQTFSSPEVDFNGAVALDVRFDLDPSGTALVAFAEAIEDILKSWQCDTYQKEFTTLDVTGLSVDEVSIGVGMPPSVDRTARKTSISIPFTLSGSYT